MKLCGMLSVLALALSGTTSYSQELEAEVPGDNFSLEGALDLFKKSESPEHFEKLLNSPDSKVNNLDLNGDGYIDYIRVFDRHEGNVHAFILQAVISEKESQDVAVIELEKRANGKAVLQIIGDEDVYGVETIIEPTSEVRTYAGTQTSTTVVNVWAWPVVRYVYAPYYVTWYSPWHWHARPVWWRPWRPVAYVHYHPIYVSYRPYYAYCHTRRITHAHHIYRPYRTTSVVVHNRHHHKIDHFRATYKDGYASRSRREDRGTSYTGRGRASQQDRLYRNNNSPTRSTSRGETNIEQSRERINTERGRKSEQTQRSDYTKSDFKRTDFATERRTRTSYERPAPSQESFRRSAPAQTKAEAREAAPSNRNSSRNFERRESQVSPARRQSTTFESRPTQSQRQSSGSSVQRNSSPTMNRSAQRQAAPKMERVQRSSPSSKPDAQRPSNGRR